MHPLIQTVGDQLPGATETERIILAFIAGLPALVAAISSLVNGRRIREHANEVEKAINEHNGKPSPRYRSTCHPRVQNPEGQDSGDRNKTR